MQEVQRLTAGEDESGDEPRIRCETQERARSRAEGEGQRGTRVTSFSKAVETDQAWRWDQGTCPAEPQAWFRTGGAGVTRLLFVVSVDFTLSSSLL